MDRGRGRGGGGRKGIKHDGFAVTSTSVAPLNSTETPPGSCSRGPGCEPRKPRISFDPTRVRVLRVGSSRVIAQTHVWSDTKTPPRSIGRVSRVMGVWARSPRSKTSARSACCGVWGYAPGSRVVQRKRLCPEYRTRVCRKGFYHKKNCKFRRTTRLFTLSIFPLTLFYGCPPPRAGHHRNGQIHDCHASRSSPHQKEWRATGTFRLDPEPSTPPSKPKPQGRATLRPAACAGPQQPPRAAPCAPPPPHAAAPRPGVAQP